MEVHVLLAIAIVSSSVALVQAFRLYDQSERLDQTRREKDRLETRLAEVFEERCNAERRYDILCTRLDALREFDE